MPAPAYEIKNSIVTTVRELQPGDHFITVTAFRRDGGDAFDRNLRIRTNDPFISKTMFGSKVRTFPSDKCHPVEALSPTT